MNTPASNSPEILLLHQRLRTQGILTLLAASLSALLLAAAVLCWWFEALAGLGIVMLLALALCLLAVTNACFLQLLNLRRQAAILRALQNPPQNT